MNSRTLSRLMCAVPLLVISGCCGGSSGGGSEPPAQGQGPTKQRAVVPRVDNATFTKSLGEDMTPRGSTTEFYPQERVNLSVAFKGRPRQGVVKASFFYHDHQIAEAQTDFALANSGLIFSVGSSTYVGFWLAHDAPLAISDAYRVAVTVDDESAGEYPFKVVPPPGAIPSKIRAAALAKGVTPEQAPIEETTSFSVPDLVHLVGRADLGEQSWIEVNWYANDQLIETATRNLTATKNTADTTFFFTARPEGGWPTGHHKAVLTLDDREAGTYQFTVDVPDAGPPSG